MTTLLHHRRVSKDDLSALYARRWNIKLDLRNLKTTTGMDVLRCQTPQMNDKQLWTQWVSRGLSATRNCAPLFTRIAQPKVGHRSGRIEPRVRMRRPKPYPWLKVPPAQARRYAAKHGHAYEPKQVPLHPRQLYALPASAHA